MAQAVTHVLLMIVLVDMYKHYFAKHKFSHIYVLYAGIAGLLPDLDYPLELLFYPYINHGDFHLMMIPIVLLVLTLSSYFLKLPKPYTMIFGISALGFFTHFGLDCLGGGYEYFLPLISLNYCPTLVSRAFWPALDSVLLLVWLIHEYFAHKIKDFI